MCYRIEAVHADFLRATNTNSVKKVIVVVNKLVKNGNIAVTVYFK